MQQSLGVARACIGAPAPSASRPRPCRLAAARREQLAVSEIVDSPVSMEIRSWRRAVIAAIAAMQIVAPLGELGTSRQLASAVLNSPNTNVPRTAEIALRRAVPTLNSSIKAIQEPLENIFYLLRIPQRRPYSSMESDVKKALKRLEEDKDSIIASIPEDQRVTGKKLYSDLLEDGLPALLTSIQEKDSDKIGDTLASSLDTLGQIKLLQASALPFLIPAQYAQYPRLNGRAVVELTVKKGDGTNFTTGQELGTIEIVLDGYSAPITAGNFANKVLKGFYDGVKLKCTQQAVLSDTQGNESIPMEILPAGEFQPLYKTTLDVQGGEIPVLPMSVYGAVAMSHSPSGEDMSSASQFFFYLYDKRSAGLGGLCFEEGQFSVFGYATKGRELLSQLKTGDIIQSARLVSGTEKLLTPT